MRNVVSQLVFALAAASCALPSYGEVFKCTTKTHHETTNDGLLSPAQSKVYVDSTFTVNVATGEWAGAPADNRTVPDRKINIVDPGGTGMSVSIVTTRGGAIGHLADLLVINTWVERREKPFEYYDANFGFFTGTCVRL